MSTQTTNVNTTIAPQTGPHASTPSVETTYEIEVMFAHSTQWTKTNTLHAEFTDPSEAWDYWTKMAVEDLWSGAQARLVQIDRRVLPSVCEPRDGWATYHRRLALVGADRNPVTR